MEEQTPTEPTAADEAWPAGAPWLAVSVETLGPDSVGRWLVRSRGSAHIFDLDAGTYSRRPGAGHARFRHDGHVVRLTRVERWPTLGEPFFIWVDDHEHPAALEHWHQSSPILSITMLPPSPSA